MAITSTLSGTLHSFVLGEEESRVRHAIFLAKQGRRVCLVCSGDPGIYAMACLVFEVVETDPSCRVAIDVIPGVSAFQTASARAGGIIGHDFCCVSLSDLLTPWEFIKRRLCAAAEADFVVALYNPRSSQRREHLKEAIKILRSHRPAETPVVVASNLGRDGERVNVVTLAAFDDSSIDMMTVVVVGSSQSRRFTRGDGAPLAFTPRGYARNRVPA
jgi:cobalt-precorrin 5A hydrolase/precorrin-3B C17-methyltransferase